MPVFPPIVSEVLETARLARLAGLRKRLPELRARMLRAKADYEAGRVSLDEEIALVRGVEREWVAVGLAIHENAATLA